MAHPLTWPVAFCITLAVEALISYGVLRGCRVRLAWRWWALAVAAANLTHPVLWWAWSRDGVRTADVLLAELVVVAVEALVWWVVLGRAQPAVVGSWRWLAAVAVSMGANAASFAVGLVVVSVLACS